VIGGGPIYPPGVWPQPPFGGYPTPQPVAHLYLVHPVGPNWPSVYVIVPLPNLPGILPPGYPVQPLPPEGTTPPPQPAPAA